MFFSCNRRYTNSRFEFEKTKTNGEPVREHVNLLMHRTTPDDDEWHSNTVATVNRHCAPFQCQQSCSRVAWSTVAAWWSCRQPGASSGSDRGRAWCPVDALSTSTCGSVSIQIAGRRRAAVRHFVMPIGPGLAWPCVSRRTLQHPAAYRPIWAARHSSQNPSDTKRCRTDTPG